MCEKDKDESSRLQFLTDDLPLDGKLFLVMAGVSLLSTRLASIRKKVKGTLKTVTDLLKDDPNWND